MPPITQVRPKPRYSLENKTFEQSTYDVTRNINKFLNILSLSGITRDANNRIVKANIEVQFSLVLLISTAVSVMCCYCRYKYTYWKLDGFRMFFAIEISGITLQTLIIFCNVLAYAI